MKITPIRHTPEKQSINQKAEYYTDTCHHMFLFVDSINIIRYFNNIVYCNSTVIPVLRFYSKLKLRKI